jgi:hypothetical protein
MVFACARHQLLVTLFALCLTLLEMETRGVWLQQGRLSADFTDFADDEGGEQEI